MALPKFCLFRISRQLRPTNINFESNKQHLTSFKPRMYSFYDLYKPEVRLTRCFHAECRINALRWAWLYSLCESIEMASVWRSYEWCTGRLLIKDNWSLSINPHLLTAPVLSFHAACHQLMKYALFKWSMRYVLQVFAYKWCPMNIKKLR